MVVVCKDVLSKKGVFIRRKRSVSHDGCPVAVVLDIDYRSVFRLFVP